MLILASQSATRKALLEKARIGFYVRPAFIDERAVEGEARARGADGAEVALELSRAKARAMAAIAPEALVIGCDQTLALGDTLLHKPKDMAAARAQLDLLRGHTHHLHAGIALVRGHDVVWEHVESAALTMRAFSEAERDEVLALEGEAVLDSVGAYRLEGPSIRLFDSIAGDYFAILGLPLLPLLAALRQHAPQFLLGAAA
jgi:septum formation protein